jgi:lysozyme family protein
MTDNFPACLAFTLQHEGGFSDRPADRGGATNMGITASTLASWYGHAVTTQQVETLPQAVAAQIYQSRYWQTVNAAALPPGLDLMVFDFGVNHGPESSVMRLQGLLGLQQDGIIGPQTLGAIKAHALNWIIATLGYSQQTFYNQLAQDDPEEAEFLAGWLARCSDRTKAAQAMVA